MATRRQQLRQIEALLKDLEPRVRDAFLAAIIAARRSVDLAALEEALAAGDWRRAVTLLTMNQVLLFPLDAALVSGYASGGATVAADALAAGVVIGFDGRHVRAETWVREYVGGFIREIVADQEAMVRSTVEALLSAGRTPAAAALDMVGRIERASGRRAGGYIGLTEAQASYALNARTELEALSREYFSRTLRDRRFDRLVERAIRDGKPLSAAQVDQITGRYRDRLLAHRGETIARTESITALRAGRREGYQQAVDAGTIADSRLTRTWDATMDSRTREDHRAMHKSTLQGMAAPWVLPDGSRMMFPGDGSLGAAASEIVRCRCYEAFDVDWLSGPMGE